MIKNILFFAGGAVVALVVTYAIRSNSPTSTSEIQGTIAQRTSQTNEVNPFTNVASIPSTVDPASIRFEKLRNVELASKTKITTDPNACKDRQFRESDVTCQSVQVIEKVKAIEARYSYNGPVLSTGESLPGRDSFSVYFHPEELSAVVSQIDKMNREQSESLFDLSTSRPMVDEKIMDKTRSRFCDGNYVDGNWVRKDANCKDEVTYVTQTVPSPNLQVQVDIRRPARSGN